MLLIVMHHFTVHGGFPLNNSDLSFNKLFLQLFGAGGKLGVNIFVLISGYFLIAAEFKLKKLFKLMSQCWFYSLLLLGLAVSLHWGKIPPRHFVYSLLPFGYNNWFAYAYITLYLLFPFINAFLKSAGQKMLTALLLLGFALWFLAPTFLGLAFNFSALIWLVYVYCVGACIRLYYDKYKFSAAGRLLAFAAAAFWTCSLALLLAGTKLGFFGKSSSYMFYFAGDKSVFMLLIAVLMFLYFKNLNIGYNKYINLIAATTFGVYLIHDSNLFRSYLWHRLLSVSQHYHSEFFMFYAIAVSLSVFVACAAIDGLRIFLLEKPFFKRFDQKIDRLQDRLYTGYDGFFVKYLK